MIDTGSSAGEVSGHSKVGIGFSMVKHDTQFFSVLMRLQYGVSVLSEQSPVPVSCSQFLSDLFRASLQTIAALSSTKVNPGVTLSLNTTDTAI